MLILQVIGWVRYMSRLGGGGVLPIKIEIIGVKIIVKRKTIIALLENSKYLRWVVVVKKGVTELSLFFYRNEPMGGGGVRL